jgi:hypothetical protein
MIGGDDRPSSGGLCFGIVIEQNHVAIERALIAFKSHGIIALFGDDLCGRQCARRLSGTCRSRWRLSRAF